MNAGDSHVARLLWVAGSLHTAHLLQQAGADVVDSRAMTAERVAGRSVIVAPSATHRDPDKIARAAGEQAHRLGAARVAILTGKALPRGALDIADYLENVDGDDPVDLQALADSSEPVETAAHHTAILHLAPIGELLSAPPEITRWLVDGMLPSGGLSILAARPKVGKSTLARKLAMDVARGNRFLGRSTVRGPVFILDLEGKRGETISALRLLGATEIDPIYVAFGPAPQDALHQLRTLAQARRPALIVVDTLQRLARVPDLNDYAKVSIALDPFIGLARETGAHLLLAHHQGRGERDGVDAPMGSTAIAGSVDTILTMKRRADGTRTLASRQRYGTDLEETVVSLEATGQVELCGLVREHEQQEATSRVVEFLRERPDSEQSEIKEGVDCRWSTVRAAITSLFKGGRIARTGAGRRGDAYRYSLSADTGISGSASS